MEDLDSKMQMQEELSGAELDRMKQTLTSIQRSLDHTHEQYSKQIADLESKVFGCLLA